MILKWCGQACFLLTSEKGTRILTDPFNKHLGYPVPRYEVEAITVSHNHYDHNYVRAVPNYLDIPILRDQGEYQIQDIHIKGLSSFHDNQGGAARGSNIIFIFQLDGLKIAHLGDLGHTFSPAQLSQLGSPDILLIPLGGTYTIGAKEATAIIEQVDSKLVLPMHYKTSTLRYPLDPLDPFLQDKQNVEFIESEQLEIKPEKLPPNQKIIILNCF